MNNSANVAKYLHVKSAILRYIEENELPVDSKIPSERELCDICRVSRMTVRRAINELAHEGFLYVVHGKGSFVQNRKIQNNLFSLTSCYEDIESQGKKPSRRVISAEVLPANAEIASNLKISVDTPVFSLKRVYKADGEPVNLVHTNIVCEYAPGVEDFNYEALSLYNVLENKLGITLHHAERFIRACKASAYVASMLEIEEGEPVLYFQGIVYYISGNHVRPIECFHAYYSTDNFNFYINQVRV